MLKVHTRAQMNSQVLRHEKNLNIVVAVGEYDSPEFQKQSQDYAKCLENYFTHVTQFTSRHEDHFSIVENLGQHNSEIARELIRIAKKEDSQNYSALSLKNLSQLNLKTILPQDGRV